MKIRCSDTKAKTSRALCFLCVTSLAFCLSACKNEDSLSEDLMTLGSESASYEETVSLSDNEPDEIYVYVCGAVVSPGVYTLASGSHVFEALEMAGGLRDDAAVDAVNQAERLTDGEQLKVPTKDEAAAELTITQSAEEDDGRININTATAEELTGLKGIGESRANDIIEYRNEHGSFKDIEDIKNVTGIKAGLYAKIKDYIKI